MKVQLASVAARAGAGPAQQLLEQYVARIRPYMTIDEAVFRSETGLLASFRKVKGPAVSVLMDPRGSQMPSRQFAGMLEGYKASATEVLLFAVGPADGWSERARAGADRLLSFGPMTFPHELARVMLAEQVYRACTILAGHPYHSGH